MHLNAVVTVYVLPLASLAAWKIELIQIVRVKAGKEHSALGKTPATVKEANYTLLSCALF